jgi:hypothetical protein
MPKLYNEAAKTTVYDVWKAKFGSQANVISIANLPPSPSPSERGHYIVRAED